MQRKLSAIAEIPKILTSTLATVAQSFGSLEAEEQLNYLPRKCSYDEDALDFELLEQDEDDVESRQANEVDEEEDEDEEDDDLVQVPDDEQLKDCTPESDYASEVNELTDEPDEEEEDSVAAHNTVYYMKLPAVAAQDTESDSDEDVNGDVDGDDSDFLSTSYTWNLRNVPKLSISDAEGVCHLTLRPQLEADTSKVRAATPTPTPTPTETPSCTLETASTASPTESQKLLFKLDKLERTWPWADREKIIYKQSTCHLVPRKPLGIVGQRIQLLAKQELLRKDTAP